MPAVKGRGLIYIPAARAPEALPEARDAGYPVAPAADKAERPLPGPFRFIP